MSARHSRSPVHSNSVAGVGPSPEEGIQDNVVFRRRSHRWNAMFCPNCDLYIFPVHGTHSCDAERGGGGGGGSVRRQGAPGPTRSDPLTCETGMPFHATATQSAGLRCAGAQHSTGRSVTAGPQRPTGVGYRRLTAHRRRSTS